MLLKDMFTFLPKSSRPASYGEKEGLYPFFTSSNTIDKFSDTADYDGEYLVIGDGGTGNCKYYNGKFSASDHNYILEPKKDTNCLLVRYFLMKDDYKVLNDGFKGVGIKNVSKTYIQNIEFKKNNKCSDSEIVDSLSKIESIITNKEKELNHLDELVKSRFIEMFGDSKYQELPFNQYAQIIDGDRGKNYPKSNDFSSEGYCLFISAKNVTKEGFIFDENQFITKEKDLSLRKGKLQRGDIIITTRGTIGNIAFYDDNVPFDNIRINSGMVIIRKNNLEYNQGFFIYAFKDKIHEILSKVSGSAQPQLPIGTMNKITICYPPISLQNEFADFVKLIDKSKFSVQKEIDLYQELLDKKMDEYFG